MGVYITPAYLKPETKIPTGLIAMSYVEELDSEFIQDNGITPLLIQDKIEWYKDYRVMVMQATPKGDPIRHKCWVNTESKAYRPIDYFVQQVTKGRLLGEFEGKYSLVESSGFDFIKNVFQMLSPDTRPMISPPNQWLVYIPNQNMLTRLCFVKKIDGKVVVRPYTSRNLMIEVHGNVEFEQINSINIFAVKRSVLVKKQLDDEWRNMAMETALEEAVESIVGIREFVTPVKPEVKPSEKKEGEVGTVE